MYFTQPLHRNLRCSPERVMTICGERRQTVRQFAERVARLAGALRQLGCASGDRIAMLGLNSDRYMEYLFAVPWAGGVLNPCNTRWSAAENAYALNDAGASVLLVDDSFLAMAEAMRPELQTLRHLIYVGDGASAPAGMLHYETLIAEAAPIPDLRCGDDTLLGIFYTGGTTGFPKGVMLSHGAFWTSQMSILAEDRLIENGDTMLRAAPMFHLADMGLGYAGVLKNATHVVVPAFHPVTVMDLIARHRTNVTLLVPTMVQMLVNHPEVRQHDLSPLRTLVYGASPIQEQVVRDVQALLPELRLFQAYGQTEMGPAISVLGPEQHTPEAAARGMLRSCGRPVASVEVRIVNPDGGDVAPGDVGEIAVRGPNMMSGYWNKPEQTAAALPPDGWLRTGDSARMDQDGYLFIMDRLKDMIVTGGENVFSAEVENALCSHPAVAMCAVIGIPNAQWGESVHAVVVPKAGCAPAPEALIEHCRSRIANYKCPKSVELRESLPLSGAGKVLKSTLREAHWRGQVRRVG